MYMIEKTEDLICRMRWKAYFFLNPEAKTNQAQKKTFGLKSNNSPPAIGEMKEFEDNMLRLVSEIKFKESQKQGDFQKKLTSDFKNIIKGSKEMLIKLTKSPTFTIWSQKNTANYYTTTFSATTYRKIDDKVVMGLEKKSKSIAENLGLDDRIEKTAKKEPFITLKDHKPNFDSNPKCRLINPTKTEIGKVSKQMLDRINKWVAKANNTNLWRSTREVLLCFNAIEIKKKFISFDVVDYYPSVIEKPLNKTLDFASKFYSITPDERDI